ncbi:hypothetical protein SAMN05428995_101815 [Loktanella sp. DSM 29012]|uniref:Flp family type IVb pilin n=1 Tax=unclassified Loktanella TaxID=290910 RepID=UPI0006FB9475|nr:MULTISPECIES: hypothetical protein [unclassified Loktanella]KQI69232.1 hypothetical protein AN189_06665 [Loktanella sp. 3ANDIMAR09]SEP79137.1 hypothetical protein SAMN05428995_101815 [Loktanella sp. DSM 29012]
MMNFIKAFYNDEDGAVTVDWVVLTAGIVVLGVAVGAKVAGGANAMADNIATELSTTTVPDITFGAGGEEG